MQTSEALTDEQIDAIADAHRWDTREGRRAMIRAALAAAPAAEPTDEDLIAAYLQFTGGAPFEDDWHRQLFLRHARIGRSIAAPAQDTAPARAGGAAP